MAVAVSAAGTFAFSVLSNTRHMHCILAACQATDVQPQVPGLQKLRVALGS